MAVFDVPFLFQTKGDLDATIKNACTVFDNEDVKAATLDKMDGVGLHGIGFWSKGFRVLATDKAINTLGRPERPKTAYHGEQQSY